MLKYIHMTLYDAVGQSFVIVGLRGLWVSCLQAIDTYELMEYNNNKGMPWLENSSWAYVQKTLTVTAHCETKLPLDIKPHVGQELLD